MKIKLTLALLIISVQSIFSQVNGKIENETYICNLFEWSIKIPKNHIVRKTDEIEEIETKGRNELEKNLPYKVKLDKPIQLINFGLDNDNFFACSFNPLEKRKKLTLIEHKKLVLELLRQSLIKYNEARFEFENEDLTIGKYKFYKIVVRGFNKSNLELAITQIYYNSFIEDHLFSSLINFNNEIEGKLLETNFLDSFNKKKLTN